MGNGPLRVNDSQWETRVSPVLNDRVARDISRKPNRVTSPARLSCCRLPKSQQGRRLTRLVAPRESVDGRAAQIARTDHDHRTDRYGPDQATSITSRQWSLDPQSSTAFRARTLTDSWNPREAKT